MWGDDLRLGGYRGVIGFRLEFAMREMIPMEFFDFSKLDFKLSG